MLVLSLFTLHPLLHDNKPVYRLQQQSIRRLAFVPPYSVFCSISFRCGGLSIERNQKPLAPKITPAVTHHDRQKQVEVKRSSRVNPHEIRLFSGCPYYHCGTEHCYLHYFPFIACVVSFFAFSDSTNFTLTCKNRQPFRATSFLSPQSFL